MSHAWNKRQRLFVNRYLQGRVIAQVAWYWCVYHIALWHAMFLAYYVQYRHEVEAGGRVLPFSELYTNFAASHIAVIICAALVLPIVLWDVLKVTHRIAGPLVRFTAVLKQLSRGESIGKFHLRRGDLLVGIQDALNEFLASPYAPQCRAPRTLDATLARNPEISEILGDIREIQASLCRVYAPESEPPANPATWANELQQPSVEPNLVVLHDSIAATKCDSQPQPENQIANPNPSLEGANAQ